VIHRRGWPIKPLPSGGKYGWEMPSDPAVEELVSNTEIGVFEVGSGLWKYCLCYHH